VSGERTPTLFDLDSPPASGPAPRGDGLTPEQAAAVAHRDGSLLLAAGAGSGKTTVLVERFVAAVLEDGIAPGRILAITFTERAAGELRERVRSRFIELGERAHARDTEGALVMTIHAFCARVLREHALAAGMDPRFRVLDDPAARALREQAYATALRTILHGPHRAAALDLAAAWGVDRTGEVVMAVYDELRSRGEQTPRLPDPGPPPELEPARRELARARDELATRLGGLSDPPPAVLVVLDRLERCRELLGRRSGAAPAGRELAELALARAGNGQACGPAGDAYAQALSAYVRACADRQAIGASRLLDRLLGAYGQAYEQAKRDASALDFDDLELHARDLLTGSPELRASWVERLEMLMVDEFQDTNQRQLEILEALERDNLLCVGDEFQSIYSFRHADVEIFRARAAAGARAVLAGNFRARTGLLRTVSAAFARVFGEGFLELEPRRSAPSAPAVELLLTDIRGWEEPDAAEVPAGPPWRRAEARLLAARVSELVAGGDVSPGDVAVLLRAASDMAIYSSALEEHGLPTLAAGAGGFWKRPEVRDLLAYLRVLANPLDEPALYSLLASPLVGVSRDGLALLALAGRAPGSGPWRAMVRSAQGPDEGADGGLADERLGDQLADSDREALGAIVGRILTERPRSAARSPAASIEGLLAHPLADARFAGPPGVEHRMANVAKLIRRAREFEAAHGPDLRGFLDHADAQARSGAREPDAPVEDAELQAVRLMTIHAAKGLEFPTVCIADLGRALGSESPPVIVDGERIGIRLPGLDGSPPQPALDYETLSAPRQQAALREEQRIFYVAATRARDRLLFSGALDPGRSGTARAGAAPVHWLAPALVPALEAELEAGDGVRRVAGAGGEPVRLQLSSPAAAAAPPRPVVRAARLPSGTAPARRAQPTRPGQPAAGALASLSYSALEAYRRCGYRFYVQRVLGLADEAPPGAGPTAGGDARRRGLLAHAALEELDFGSPRVLAGPELAMLADARGLAVEEPELAQVAKLVQAFASSPLCARLARARAVHREHPFALTLPGTERASPLLTGVIDVLAHEPDGGALVIDYKTDRLSRPPGGDGEVYPVQRSVYALAVLRAGAPTVEVAHCFLEAPESPVGRRYAVGEADALEREIAALVHAVQGGRFPVAEHPHRELCLTCPARRRLCSWDEELTLRPARAGQAP